MREAGIYRPLTDRFLKFEKTKYLDKTMFFGINRKTPLNQTRIEVIFYVLSKNLRRSSARLFAEFLSPISFSGSLKHIYTFHTPISKKFMAVSTNRKAWADVVSIRENTAPYSGFLKFSK